ncbi:MAG: LysR family transcriptional regulator [Lautropia sp.]
MSRSATGSTASLTASVSLRQLEILVRVADAGSMSAAAEQLEFKQPTVSQSVGALEKALGVQLFDRSVRPPALTLAGATVVRHARGVLAQLRALESALQPDGDLRLARLRIGMLDSFASTAGPYVADQLRDLAAELTVTSGFQSTTFQALVDRRVDVIVTADTSPVPDGIAVLPLLEETFLLALPASFPAPIEQLGDLVASLPYIRYGRAAHMLTPIERYFEQSGVNPSARFQFDTTDAVMRMVSGGFGWTLLTPLIFVKSLGPRDMVRALPLPHGEIRRQLVVATRRDESPRLGSLIRRIAGEVLRTHVLPQVRGRLPDVGRFDPVADSSREEKTR